MKKSIKMIIASGFLAFAATFAFSLDSSADPEFCTYLQEDDMSLCDPAGNTCIVIAPCPVVT